MTFFYPPNTICHPIAKPIYSTRLNRIFFLISNKDIYSRTLPYAEKHKAERKLQREKIKKKEKRKEKILITTGES